MESMLSSMDTTGFQFEITCPVQRPLLNILRRFITSVAEEMGFSSDDVMKIEVAVDEACTNAFLHAYDGMLAGQHGGIQLKLQIGPESLTVQIRDEGKGLREKKENRVGSLQSYQQSGRESYHGLGMVIMQEFMDDVQYDVNTNPGTLVTLRKFLKPNSPSANEKQV
jgi:serine/threonine-protein kinase RsbW